jgi:AcrR family transcriptional regulator
MDSIENAQSVLHKAGRPRRGTEHQRMDALIQAATQVFLKEGYGLASIDKIANAAGISTRTIYERFKNKGDLMAAVVERLLDRDMAVIFAESDLDRLEVATALALIGATITQRFADPDSAALFRIIVTESLRFPELSEKVRCKTRERFDSAIAGYLRRQVERGTLALDDPERAAVLFAQMLLAEPKECVLFRSPDAVHAIDLQAHVAGVVRLFLLGAAPRPALPSPVSSSP